MWERWFGVSNVTKGLLALDTSIEKLIGLPIEWLCCYPVSGHYSVSFKKNNNL
jgi:hypothetical protein